MVEPNSDYREDLELRDRVLAGDREAADRFFEGHLDSLYEFVHYRVGRDRALAEDIVQETMLDAVRGLAGFDGRSTLYTWLCAIAKNKVSAWRRRRRPVSVEDLLEESEDQIESILAEVDREPLPEWVLERRETRELVGATLSSLPPDYRTALIGKYLEGRSVADLGRALNRGEKAAESTLSRARLAFSRVFGALAKKREELT